jgi:IclR family pca regulon transcriptional regulator
MLCSLSDEELDRRFEDYEFRKFTETTIETLDELKSALAEDRKRGYVAQASQLAEGTVAIAAPIYDRSNYAIGAVNISGHRNQLTATEDLIQMVRQCAERISEMQ